MSFRGAGIPRSELSEPSVRGRPDLSRKILSRSHLGYNHEAAHEQSEPGCCCSSGTSDFRMVLTQHLQGVTMPAVRNAVEAERQWRRTIRSKRRRAKITSPTGDAPKGNGDPSTAFVPVIPIEVGREQPKPIQIPSRLGALSLAVGVGMFAKQKANALSSTGPTILNK